MKISVITVTKNNKPGLLRAIECVRNQTYKNVEHIIVDGDSTDGSVEAIKNEQLKIKNLEYVSEPDKGIYDAINKGIKLATGKVIGLLHSDDLYADENVIARYVEVFASDSKLRRNEIEMAPVIPANEVRRESASDSRQAGMTGRIDAVYSDLVYVSKKLEVRSKKSEDKSTNNENTPPVYSLLSTDYSIIRYWKAHAERIDSGSSSGMTTSGYQTLITDHLINRGWMPPHPTLFIRKEIFEKYGLYNTELKIASDYEMILRLFWKYKISATYLPNSTYLMSIGGASNKNLNNILLKSKEDLLALRLHDLPHPIVTLFSKNFRKLPQFLARDLS